MKLHPAIKVLIPLNSGRDTDSGLDPMQKPVHVLIPLNSGRDTDSKHVHHHYPVRRLNPFEFRA